MATTITRSVWTDGVGGTIINNATKNTDIYDPIDEILANNVTFGGLVNAEGFGAHTFSAGGTGGNSVRVVNTSAGTSNLASVELGNDADADLGRIEALSSSFTSSGPTQANGLSIRSLGAGGLNLSAEHASGPVRIFALGTTKFLSFNGETLDVSGGQTGPRIYSSVLTDSVNTTQVGTDADTTQKDLHSYTLPADTLTSDGRMVRFTAGGTFAANANTKTIRAYFGATQIIEESHNWNGRDWYCTATVVRTGATSQKSIGVGPGNTANTNTQGQYATPAETLSGNVTMKVTGQNGTATANDIVCEFSYVELLG